MSVNDMGCSACGKRNTSGARFCATCGVMLPIRNVEVSEEAAHAYTQEMHTREIVGDYEIVRAVVPRHGPIRTYEAVSIHNSTQAFLLHEALGASDLDALRRVASGGIADGRNGVARLQQMFDRPWYGRQRFYAPEFVPSGAYAVNEVGDALLAALDPALNKLLTGLAGLHKLGFSFGFAPQDVGRYVGVSRGEGAYWRHLAGLGSSQRNISASMRDLCSLDAYFSALTHDRVSSNIQQSLHAAVTKGVNFSADDVLRLAETMTSKATRPIDGPSTGAPATRVLTDAPRKSLVRRAEFGKCTHVGNVRFTNEDSVEIVTWAANESGREKGIELYIVADGMGGEDAGEVASKMCIDLLINAAAALIDRTDSSVVNYGEWLLAAVVQVNAQVVADAKRRGNTMGSTLVCALVVAGEAYLGNVGDSRIYRWNLRRQGGAVERLVKDHSLVQRLVDLDQIKDEDRYTHPDRNMILRSMGDPANGYSDQNERIDLEPGDHLILCSDGLWEYVRDQEMPAVLQAATSPGDAARQLVDLANERGGDDNISVIVARYS